MLARRSASAAAGGNSLLLAPQRRGFFHIPLMGAGMAIAGIAKVLMVKKVGFWGAYGATKVYGWPRVCRNLLKFNRDTTPRAAQSTVQAGIVAAIRTPAEAYSLFQDTEVYAFIGRVANSTSQQIPPWVQALAGSIAGKTHVWKALKEMESEGLRVKAKEMAVKAGAPHPLTTLATPLSAPATRRCCRSLNSVLSDSGK